MTSEFDPSAITPTIAKRIAESLESYLKLLKDIRVTPPEVEKKYGKQIEEGDRRTEKLIKKLRKGKIEDLFKEDI